MISFVSRTSLKGLLVGGFLVCALLTGLSGGAGIYSLSEIKTIMGQSADHVVDSVERQHIRIQQLISVRKMVAQIAEARNLEDLGRIETQLKAAQQGASSVSDALQSIFEAVADLAKFKRNQITALVDLNQLTKTNVAILETITQLTILSVKASENESIEGIEKETRSIKSGFGKLMRSQKTEAMTAADLEKLFSRTGINDMMDELMMVSEMSISAVRAAMSVQSRTNRQLVVVNDLVGAADLTTLEQTANEINKLHREINSELVELPEDGTTAKIVTHLKALSGSIETMIGAKKTEIGAADELRRQEAYIQKQIGAVENRVLSDGKQLSGNVMENMQHSGENVSRWQLSQIILVIVAIVLALGIGFFVSGLITTPINQTIAAFKDIAQGDGDLTFRLDDSAKNEIGRMGYWFNGFIQKMQGVVKEIAEGVATLSTFSMDLSHISEKMTQGVRNVTQKSQTVSSAADEMSVNMNSVAAAMEETAANTNMVADASEEMSATIGEIARHAEKARGISENAAQQASRTSSNMNQLGQAAISIGRVVETITEISEQVNLLALNATIEAARAGEAGKGFAVVANEIKELAKQTAAATHDIKEKISGIQSTTTTTVDQIADITEVISEVNDVVATIATAVEQQSASTKEIANSVAQASQGIHEVNENVNQSSSVSGEISSDIAEVSHSMNDMSANSSQVLQNAQELAGLSKGLKEMVDQFKV